LALALGALTLWVAAYAAHAALPHNTVRLPGGEERGIRSVLPEGWKFFTRPPQEPRLAIHRRDEGVWRPINAEANAEPRHLFGLRRAARAQPMEAASLLGGVAATAWRKCEVAPERCLDEAALAAEAENQSRTPTLCGDLGFVRQPPVPWAWARRLGPVTMHSKVVRVRVRCST